MRSILHPLILIISLLLGVTFGVSIWNGGTTSTETRIIVRRGSGNDLQVIHSDSGNTLKNISIGNEFEHVYVNGLEENTRYEYRVVEKSGNVLETGKFKTFPTTRKSFKFGFGSCSYTGSNSRVFDSMRNRGFDLFLHLGDLHYLNIKENRQELFDQGFDLTFESEAQKEFLKSTSIAYIYDDHDFGANNYDSTDGTVEAATASFDKNVPQYPTEFGDYSSRNRSIFTGNAALFTSSHANYQAFTYGKVRFIIPDLRAESANEKGLIFSENQTQWIFQELSNHNSYDLIVFASSKEWLGNNLTENEKSQFGEIVDTWRADPVTRARIANYISENSIKNIIFVAGDMHAIGVDNGRNTDYSTRGSSGAGVPLFHASPLDQFGSPDLPPFSEGCHAYTLWRNEHYGAMEVYYNASNSTCIKFEAYDANAEKSWITYQACAPFVIKGTPNTANSACQAKIFPAIGWAFVIAGGILVFINIFLLFVLPVRLFYKLSIVFLWICAVVTYILLVVYSKLRIDQGIIATFYSHISIFALLMFAFMYLKYKHRGDNCDSTLANSELKSVKFTN